MKIKFIVFLNLLLQSIFALSQVRNSCIENNQSVFIDLVTNGDLVQYDSTCLASHSCVQPCPDAINSGCLNAWHASHGSPEFSIPDHAVVMGSVKAGGYLWGEGVYQVLDQPIDSGNSYLLVFDYGLTDFTDSSFLSVQFTNQEFHSGSCFEMLPAPGWEITGGPFSTRLSQQTAILIFKALDTYSKVWFYNMNVSDSVSWIKIRNIHLFRTDDISTSEIVELLHELLPEGDLQLQLMLSENCYDGNQKAPISSNPCQEDYSKGLIKRKIIRR